MVKINNNKLKLYFPHITRNITAAFGKIYKNLLMVAIFAWLVTINGFFLKSRNNSQETKLRNQILNQPFTSTNHLALSQFYKTFNPTAALKENQLAFEYAKSEPVNKNLLGISDITTLDKNTDTADSANNSELSFWQIINKNYPGYDYSYLKLASLYNAFGDQEMAKTFLEEYKKATYDTFEE